MASAERHKGDDNTNNPSSAAVTNVVEEVTVQSYSTEVSRCDLNSLDNIITQIISSHLEEMNLSKTSQSKEISGKRAQEKQNDGPARKVENIAGDEEDFDVSSTFEEAGKSCMQLTNTEKELLKEELKLLQCPFTWNLNYKNSRTTTEALIAKCNNKLDGNDEEEEEEENDEEFEWRKFILTVILSYEHSINGSSSEALSKLQECETFINKCQSSGKPDEFFQNIKEALQHVVDASKCHLLVSLNMLSEAIKLKQCICKYEDLNKRNMAAIFGIQSTVLLEYGFEGIKAAIEYAEKAVNLDGNEAEWQFLYGKALGCSRRIEDFTEIPSQQELSALEQSVRTSKNATRIVFLAQAYREAAAKVFVKNKDNLDSLKDIINKMNERASQLYWEALELDSNTPSISMRCAAGLFKLPRPFQDLHKAEELIQYALKFLPNNAMAHHIAGNLYEKLSNFDLAEKFYKRSGELGAYGADINLLALKFRRDREYEPLSALEQMLEHFPEAPRVQETYLQMGSYMFHFKNDTFAALDYWMKGIEVDPSAAKLKVHKCTLLDMKTPVNVYQVVADETRLALQQVTLADEDVVKLRKMLRYCTEKYPELLANEPKSWRMDSIKAQSIRRRRENANTGRGAGRWRSGVPEEYGNTSRDNSSSRHDCRSKFQQHENWRQSPRNVSFSGEVCQEPSGTNEQLRRDEKWQSNPQQKQSNSKASWRNKD